MRNFWLILSVLWLWTCSGGGDKATGPEEPPIVINLTSLGGQAQKGPFNNGTAINVAELTNTLSPTGRNFSSAITDNTGRFAVANVQLESPYVELRANGFYFNEVTNEISDAQLTLFAISNLTGKTSLNVNILTHLEKNRIVNLMSGDNPKTFAQAKLQAQEEVLAIFDYSRANVPESELLDISQDGAANAKLLAMSAIIQGDLTVGQMSQLLANMSTDIASDGTLDDTNLRNTLIENSKNLDMAEVRSNLVAHYASLGISATIPDFESEINQFLKPPVAQDMSASTGEDTPINITLAASDPEGESLTYTILQVNNATVTLNSNVANYSPDLNFYGTDTFTYYANDGTSDSNIATVTMTVSGEDDDPNTQNAAATTDEDVAVELQLTAEEYDGDSYSFGIITEPTNGSVSLDGENATYTPNQDWNGEDTFTFEATDDTGRMMNVGTATITVNAINDNPTMRDTTFTFEEDCLTGGNDSEYCIDIDVLDYLFNDIDSNSGNASVTLNSEPQHGSLFLQDARFLYDPNKDWYGEDSITYVVNDGDGGVSNVASINLIATPVNDAPEVEDISFSILENYTGYGITIKGDNATDVDGDAIAFYIVSPPSNGNVYNDAGGGIPAGSALAAGDMLSSYYTIYNPNTDFVGNDSFTFKASDGTLDSNIATVSIEVIDNSAPIANDRIIKFEKNVTKTFDLSASDADNHSLTFSIVSSPASGSVSLSGSTVTYTPNTDYVGNDSFTFKANDGFEDSNTATISLFIDPEIILTEQYASSKNNNIGFSIKQTSDGGFVIIGAAYRDGFNDEEVLVIKTDANGNQEWLKTININAQDLGFDITELSDGSFAAIGSYDKGNGGNGMLMMKLDSQGNLSWSRQNTWVGGRARDYFYARSMVHETSDGNIIFAGIYKIFKYDTSGNEIWETNSGSYLGGTPSIILSDDSIITANSFGIEKFDSSGNKIWDNNSASVLPMNTNNSLEMISWISATDDGGFIASGTISNQTLPGIGYYDAYLSKFDASGNQEWYKTYDDAFKTYGEAGYEYGNAAIPTSDGGYLLVGGIETSDLMVIKTDANGTRIWQKRHSIDGNTFGNSVVEVSPGVYAITGNTNGSNRKAYLLQLQE